MRLLDRWRSLLLATSLSLVANVHADTIQLIQEAQVDASGMLPNLPQSAFHDWDESKAEVAVIVAAWQTEPASLAWTRIQLARFIKHKTMPTRGARGLALVHVAMHDAHALAEQRGLSQQQRRLALSMAAADVLGYLYPAEERAFERIVFALAARLEGVAVDAVSERSRRAFALGRVVANQTIARAQDDGAQYGWNGARLQYYGQDRYYGPGSWEPTPPYFYYPPDEPFAPRWKTWVLASAHEFRPTPPQFASKPYMDSLDEVIRINREVLATTPAPVPGAPADAPKPVPTDERFRIAKFWVDGHGSVTPPGHWNQIAIDEVLRASLDEQQTLRLFAQLDVALADSFIACWDAKYYYWTVRPVTAAKKLRNVDLSPLVLTPPFPSYPSGHATFSAAAAGILSSYFPLRTDALQAMAEEAAHSRMFGGIHFRFDDEDGLMLGSKIAKAVLQRIPSAPSMLESAATR